MAVTLEVTPEAGPPRRASRAESPYSLVSWKPIASSNSRPTRLRMLPWRVAGTRIIVRKITDGRSRPSGGGGYSRASIGYHPTAVGIQHRSQVDRALELRRREEERV